MPPEVEELRFNTDFKPATGAPEVLAEGIVRITAPNRGPYTFTGTNSFLLGTHDLFVVDPGPDDETHRQALLKAIGNRSVAAILLTHTHKDHSALAPILARDLSSPLWFGGRHRLSRPRRALEINLLRGSSDWRLTPDRILADGDLISAKGISIQVVATPGHCANHLAFGVVNTPWLLTGDHVMGWNSTLVAVPDGSMHDYLRSLEHLQTQPWTHYLPAHGGGIPEGKAYARALKAHREMRNGQILAAVSAGAENLDQIVRAIYPGLQGKLRMAARMTVQAHLEYLEELGRLHVARGLIGTRIKR